MLPGGDLEKIIQAEVRKGGLEPRERERCAEVSLGRLKQPSMLG